MWLDDLAEDLMSSDNPESELEEHNLIGKGNTRACLEIDFEPESFDDYWAQNGLCAKIPLDKHGVFQNSQEVYNWEELFEASGYILPVLDYSPTFRYIIMPRGQPLENKYEEFCKFKRELEQEVPVRTVDITIENCVIYRGDIYVSDYGMMHKK